MAVEDADVATGTAAMNADPVVNSGAEFRSRLHWFIGASDVRTQDPGSLTYEPYFSLREKPFSLSSDPRFFFSHSSHGAAFDTLAAGIRRREGLLVLTGEVGTGKTTLCRAVLQSLDQKTFAAFVPDPFLTREDLLKTLLIDFGVVSVDEIRSGRLRGASRTDLSYPLYDFLTSLQPLKAFAVVMIDEAQNLTAELLEEVRILSDLENGQKLLEVVLVGQPELQSRLATATMRQLSQRVSIRCELSPLDRADVTRYVSHRLTVAGNDGRVQFTGGAIEFVWAVSKGNPRVINLVCDRALFCAARSRTMSVKAEHVIRAVEDLKLPVDAAFDHARALGSFPEEFSKAPAKREEQPPLPPTESIVPAEEPPADPFKSFLKEPWQAPAERQNRPQPAQGQAVLHVSEPVAAGSVAPARVGAPSPILDLSGANFDRPAVGHPSDAKREISRPSAVWNPAAKVRFAAVRRRQRIWLAPVAVSLVFIAGFVAIWYSMEPLSPAQSGVLEQPALPGVSLQASPGDTLNSSAPPDGGRVTSAPGDSSATGGPPVGEGDRAVVEARAADQIPAGFAVQMATFQSAGRAAQAAQEFRGAGYLAYSVERSLRDGTRVHAVILGPYVARAQAERDRARAREIPGYDSGLIIPIDPALLSQKVQ
jgi:type II secretory pathway predicted ATPase ExeA